jgi:heat shock protein HslJ
MEARRRGAILMLAWSALLAAYGTKSSAADRSALEGTSWVLSSLPGRMLVDRGPVTLQFASGRVSGSDGCNRFAGGYSAEPVAFQVSPPLASTQMACTPELSAQAQAFMAALAGARSYRVAAGRLELFGEDGSIRAALASQSQSLAGTSWRVTGINNGTGAVASLARDSSVTLTFDAEGGVSGSAGCNQFSADYRSSASGLAFGPAAVARRTCAHLTARWNSSSGSSMRSPRCLRPVSRVIASSCAGRTGRWRSR